MPNYDGLPTLLIGDVPALNAGFNTTIEPSVYLRLRHRKRFYGGHWELTFFLSDADYGSALLDEYFNSWLMYQIAEYFQSEITWRGVVWEVARIKDGKKTMRSMSNVWNAVKCVYTTTGSTTQQETAYQENDDSISRYLRREYLVYKDNVSATQAAQEAQNFLNVSYDAWAKATDYNTTAANGLEITAVGMGRLFNNLFCTVTTPPGTVNVDVFVDDIWDTDLSPNLPFLTLGRQDDNNRSVERERRTPTRCGDLIDTMARGGNGTTPFRWFVGSNLEFNHQEFDSTPSMEWRGRKRGGLFAVGGKKLSWNAEPGVIEDVTIASVPSLEGDFLQNRNHDLAEQFSMWQGQESPIPELEEADEAQLLANVEAFQKLMTDGNFDRLHTPGSTMEGR